MGFEPTTPTLARLCSTPELHPLGAREGATDMHIAEGRGECKARRGG